MKTPKFSPAARLKLVIRLKRYAFLTCLMSSLSSMCLNVIDSIEPLNAFTTVKALNALTRSAS